MRRHALPLSLTLLAAAAIAGCGYFNSLYNAEHKFADAERAEARGERGIAMSAYEDAIKRAAVSYQKYPHSRWADDALLLIARAHFHTGADRQAAAALERLLGETKDPDIRNAAFAYLGAARVRLNDARAMDALDSAVMRAPKESGTAAFSRLWRGRARFSAADTAGAWADLESISPLMEKIGADATVERMMRAITLRDSARWQREVRTLVAQQAAAVWADSVRALLTGSVAVWGPRFVSNALPETAGAGLPEAQQLQLRLMRAELRAAAGDTAAAITDGLRVATASATETSAQARVRVAQWMLGGSADPADFGRIRSILVPAYSNPYAFALIQQLRAVEVLIDRSASDPIALFVAAEFARDELQAPRVARALFTRFEALPVVTPWDGKALLAGLDLAETDAQRAQIQSRLAGMEGNVYVEAVRGEADSVAYSAAESQLRRETTVLRAEALKLASEANVSVGRAVAVRDSIRNVLRRDSVMNHCGVLIDSLKVKGIRADSARVACIRTDTARFNAVLRMDTSALRPPRPDTIR